MRFSRELDIEVIARTRRLVKRSRALLAASRRMVPARLLNNFDREADDHLVDLRAQPKLRDGHDE